MVLWLAKRRDRPGRMCDGRVASGDRQKVDLSREACVADESGRGAPVKSGSENAESFWVYLGNCGRCSAELQKQEQSTSKVK